MKKTLMKFSDERNRRFSIKTVMVQDDGNNNCFILKSNVYPEGIQHINQIFKNAKLLTEAYPEVVICPVQMQKDSSLKFDYIEGVSLEQMYQELVQKRDRDGIEKLVKNFCSIILGSPDNRCEFRMTPQFQEVFGIDAWAGSSSALKVSNFDSTAGNIIYQDNKPVFIDYEWVCDFPVPEELVLYYNIRDAYYHVCGLEEVYPWKEAKKAFHFEISDRVLQTACQNFNSYVVREKDGSSYGLSKHINIKGMEELKAILTPPVMPEPSEEIKKLNEKLRFAEKNWKETCQANFMLSQKINKLSVEVEQEKENHRIHAQQIEAAVQEQARQSETWRIAYETVIHSKTWKFARKVKRLFGKK